MKEGKNLKSGRRLDLGEIKKNNNACSISGQISLDGWMIKARGKKNADQSASVPDIMGGHHQRVRMSTDEGRQPNSTCKQIIGGLEKNVGPRDRKSPGVHRMCLKKDEDEHASRGGGQRVGAGCGATGGNTETWVLGTATQKPKSINKKQGTQRKLNFQENTGGCCFCQDEVWALSEITEN